MLQEASHIKNTVFLIFQYIQCLHLMYSEVAWVLVPSENPQLENIWKYYYFFVKIILTKSHWTYDLI